jgi:hypothetical protein
MVAADFLQDPRVQGWLDGVEPAWTLLTFESLLALRHEPSAVQSAIQIANDLSVGEIAGSPVARNTLILLGQAIERVGLPLTATGNLSRATVAEMCKLIEWPDFDQADAFRLNKVINEPDFLPLEPAMFSETWDRTRDAMEAKILRPLLWFGLLEHRSEKLPKQPVRRASFLSQDGVARSIARL